jgi:esterase/lipase superfamily enzyme
LQIINDQTGIILLIGSNIILALNQGEIEVNAQETKNFSEFLNQVMVLRVYGKGGKPVLVFPTLKGRYFDFENFGMVESVQKLIDDEKVALITVDSIDAQSLANDLVSPAQRIQRHEEYDQYIIKEVVPFIQNEIAPNKKIFTAGCDMGGYHAANFFFRYPEVFDGTISLSGWFQLQQFVGNFLNSSVYFHSPLRYLPNLTDEWFLEKFQQSQIVICAGQGQWEEVALANAHALQQVLNEKEIPCWVDYWGMDVCHDWPWWRKQFPYFLNRLELD